MPDAPQQLAQLPSSRASTATLHRIESEEPWKLALASMELRSPSSTTRETRPRPSPSALSSSDAGEKEEAMSTRPDYWSSVEDICLPIPGVKACAGNASPEVRRENRTLTGAELIYPTTAEQTYTTPQPSAIFLLAALSFPVASISPSLSSSTFRLRLAVSSALALCRSRRCCRVASVPKRIPRRLARQGQASLGASIVFSSVVSFAVSSQRFFTYRARARDRQKPPQPYRSAAQPVLDRASQVHSHSTPKRLAGRRCCRSSAR